MRIAILSCGAIVVREKDQSWLFGAPDGVKQALDAAGIEVPGVVFTTALRSPGFQNLGPVLRFKESPLTMNGMSAKPVTRKHGTDYVIDAGHGKVLFSERGDVSVEDTEGYHLAIIKNKHRADAFGDHVITWPWKDSEFLVQDGVTTPLFQDVQLKVWSSMEDVPSNLKSLDGAPLSLDQANLIARIAKASGEGDENWAIGISTFKKSHTKEGDHWVKAADEKEKSEEAAPQEEIAAKEFDSGKPIPRIADIITAALHKAYNDTSDKLYQIGYLSQEERLKVASSIGDGLDAFRAAIGGEEFATRAVDKWDADQFMVVKANDDSFISVFKSKDDTWRWATITSAATWDRQGELLPPSAMDWAIGFSKMLTKMTGANARGPLRYKHIPGFDGGVCDTQVRVGDFLFEAGTFDDTPIGLAMRRKLKEDPEIWQISPGLAFAKEDLQGGVYKRAAIFERSMTQRPANPFTIAIHKEHNGESQMKILTEQELKSAAEELGLEYEEAKMMYERAIAAGSGPLGLKEFTEVVEKATGTNGSGFPGGANSTHKKDGEADETEMLKEAIEELTLPELEHLAGLVASTLKEKADEEDGEEEEMEETDGKKKKMPPFMKKGKDEDEPVDDLAQLKELLVQQTQLIVQQTKAVNDLVGAVTSSSSARQAADELLNSLPRRQSTLTSRAKSVSSVPADDAVAARLAAIETALKESQQRHPGQALYDQFTSTQLNRPKGGIR